MNSTIVEMADRFLASNSSACQAYSISIAQTDIRILILISNQNSQRSTAGQRWIG